MESPDWGGWGGRYVRVRDNTWLDPVPEPGYQYPEGRWFTSSAWGRSALRENNKEPQLVAQYFKPLARWTDALQNDFAARADWCVKSYARPTTHQLSYWPRARLMRRQPGDTVQLERSRSS